MNPVQQIGRYQLPLLSVVAIRRRSGLKLRFLVWLIEKLNLDHELDLYDVLLSNGHRLRFTQDEKEEYNTAMEWHAVTLQVYGSARGLGLRG